MKKILIIFAVAIITFLVMSGIVVYAGITKNTQTKTITMPNGDIIALTHTYTECPVCPVCPTITPESEPEPEPIVVPNTCGNDKYCWHTGITATIFWIGEPQGNGSSEDNAVSAYDGDWQAHYGGYDDYQCRNGWHPCGFTPKENPFYVTVPYENTHLKNRWVRIERNGITAYGQVEDSGPYVYHDYNYVYKCAPKPLNRRANNAGMDVSPALRDYLKFEGLNNDENKVNWQFVDWECVEPGPWKEIITRSEYNW